MDHEAKYPDCDEAGFDLSINGVKYRKIIGEPEKAKFEV
jgi:hypothetical protein